MRVVYGQYVNSRRANRLVNGQHGSRLGKELTCRLFCDVGQRKVMSYHSDTAFNPAGQQAAAFHWQFSGRMPDDGLKNALGNSQLESIRHAASWCFCACLYLILYHASNSQSLTLLTCRMRPCYHRHSLLEEEP